MQLHGDDSVQLTYCTNIHPGNGWEEVFGQLRRYAPALKQRLSPGAPFGLGLRLSAAESAELLRGDCLEQFREFLAEHDLYVALLNGFPYGAFHQGGIKAEVFAPDWRQEERVGYTLRLIEILKRLLPGGMEGGISTSPLSYKGWVAPKNRDAWESITRQLVRVVEALIRVRQNTGQLIHLDLEPEPDGLIETSGELVAFYEEWLLPVGGTVLAEALGVPVEEAQASLREHLQVCLDTCHVAVEYEDPKTVLERLARAGIRVGRLQISSALKVALPDSRERRAELARELEPFAESRYLHQVIERGEDGRLEHYPDLGEALPRIQEPRAGEWRIHFHVPLFVGEYGRFGSTQEENRTFFRCLEAAATGAAGPRPLTRHLEIETYTWEVLPPALKQDLLTSIEREYRWVLDELSPVAAPVGACRGGREAEGPMSDELLARSRGPAGRGSRGG
jgi:sugar phosphate isomerase/epimerase